MKIEKAPEPLEVSLELIAASWGVCIQMMTEICQSPRWIWNVSGMGSKHCGSNLQGEGRHREL